MKSNLVAKLFTNLGVASIILFNYSCNKPVIQFETASGNHVAIYSLNDSLKKFEVIKPNNDKDIYINK